MRLRGFVKGDETFNFNWKARWTIWPTSQFLQAWHRRTVTDSQPGAFLQCVVAGLSVNNNPVPGPGS